MPPSRPEIATFGGTSPTPQLHERLDAIPLGQTQQGVRRGRLPRLDAQLLVGNSSQSACALSFEGPKTPGVSNIDLAPQRINPHSPVLLRQTPFLHVLLSFLGPAKAPGPPALQVSGLLVLNASRHEDHRQCSRTSSSHVVDHGVTHVARSHLGWKASDMDSHPGVKDAESKGHVSFLIWFGMWLLFAKHNHIANLNSYILVIHAVLNDTKCYDCCRMGAAGRSYSPNMQVIELFKELRHKHRLGSCQLQLPSTAGGLAYIDPGTTTPM